MFSINPCEESTANVQALFPLSAARVGGVQYGGLYVPYTILFMNGVPTEICSLFRPVVGTLGYLDQDTGRHYPSSSCVPVGMR
jgi:hypothetical protein